MRFWEPCPAPSANLKVRMWLWRPFWPARLLPQGGFLPFLYLLRAKEVPFIALCAPFPKQLSVPHVLASYFTVRNTFPSLLSFCACRASCYCQSKTSSFFPLPHGLYMLHLVPPAFASPKSKRIECKDQCFCTQAQKLSSSRTAGASASIFRADKSPFPSSPVDMALPLT